VIRGRAPRPPRSRPDDFLYATYFWKSNDGGVVSDAILVDADQAIANANGTDHDIPNVLQCHQCHDKTAERILGFGAIRLGRGAVGFEQRALGQAHLLSSPPPADLYAPPGDAIAAAALGYLHAKCGSCHNETPGVYLPDPGMDLRLRVSDKSLTDTGAFRTAINVALGTYVGHVSDGIAFRIEGGKADQSAVLYRMAQRAAYDPAPGAQRDPNQMPPLASKYADTAGIAIVRAFIDSLPPRQDQ
jgi:hypothetical protein